MHLYSTRLGDEKKSDENDASSLHELSILHRARVCGVRLRRCCGTVLNMGMNRGEHDSGRFDVVRLGVEVGIGPCCESCDTEHSREKG